MEDAYKDKLELWESGDGWRWRRWADNGRMVANSGEGYTDKDHAIRMAESRNPGIKWMEPDETAPDE